MFKKKEVPIVKKTTWTEEMFETFYYSAFSYINLNKKNEEYNVDENGVLKHRLSFEGTIANRDLLDVVVVLSFGDYENLGFILFRDCVGFDETKHPTMNIVIKNEPVIMKELSSLFDKCAIHKSVCKFTPHYINPATVNELTEDSEKWSEWGNVRKILGLRHYSFSADFDNLQPR